MVKTECNEMQFFHLSGGRTDVQTRTGNKVLEGVLDWKAFSLSLLFIIIRKVQSLFID